MIYIEEKHKNPEVGGIFQTEWKQCKIAIDNEKSHIVQPHGAGFDTGHIIQSNVLKTETSQSYFLGFDLN